MVSTPAAVKAFMLKLLELLHLLDTGQYPQEGGGAHVADARKMLGIKRSHAREFPRRSTSPRSARRRSAPCKSSACGAAPSPSSTRSTSSSTRCAPSSTGRSATSHPLDFAPTRWELPWHLLDALVSLDSSGAPATWRRRRRRGRRRPSPAATGAKEAEIVAQLQPPSRSAGVAAKLDAAHAAPCAPLAAFYLETLRPILAEWLLLLAAPARPARRDRRAGAARASTPGAGRPGGAGELSDRTSRCSTSAPTGSTTCCRTSSQGEPRPLRPAAAGGDARRWRAGRHHRLPRSRRYLAVPFVGKDAPSHASEYAHPDVADRARDARLPVRGAAASPTSSRAAAAAREPRGRAVGPGRRKRPSLARVDRLGAGAAPRGAARARDAGSPRRTRGARCATRWRSADAGERAALLDAASRRRAATSSRRHPAAPPARHGRRRVHGGCSTPAAHELGARDQVLPREPRLPRHDGAPGDEALGQRPGARRRDALRAADRLLGHAVVAAAARDGRVRLPEGRRRQDAPHAHRPRRRLAPRRRRRAGRRSRSSTSVAALRPPVHALIDAGALVTGLSNRDVASVPAAAPRRRVRGRRLPRAGRPQEDPAAPRRGDGPRAVRRAQGAPLLVLRPGAHDGDRRPADAVARAPCSRSEGHDVPRLRAGGVPDARDRQGAAHPPLRHPRGRAPHRRRGGARPRPERRRALEGARRAPRPERARAARSRTCRRGC